MILEAISHLLSPCSRRLKRLGVLYDLLALKARARRCHQAWGSHQAFCRAAIMSAAARSGEQSLCVVLGSGLLLEIPLDGLLERFERVVLVDLYHLGLVRRCSSRFGKRISLDVADLSGVLGEEETALEKVLGQGRPLPSPCFSVPWGAEADLVISANCLSQIPLIPLRVAWNAGRFTPDALCTWGAMIQSAHLQGLCALGGKAFFIGDIERFRFRAGTRELLGREDLLHGLSMPEMDFFQEWFWNIAPAPEERRTLDIVSRVVAGTITGRTSLTDRGLSNISGI